MSVIKQFIIMFFIWQLAGCCSLNVCIYCTLHFSMVPLKIIILEITWDDNALLMKTGQSSYFWVWLEDWEFYLLSSMFGLTLWFTVEAHMAERLTPGTLDLEVQGSSFAHGVVSLDNELYFTLSLFIEVYEWVPATYCRGVTLRWTSIPARGE